MVPKFPVTAFGALIRTSARFQVPNDRQNVLTAVASAEQQTPGSDSETLSSLSIRQRRRKLYPGYRHRALYVAQRKPILHTRLEPFLNHQALPAWI